MEITFQLYGLSFTAQVDYTPADPGRLSGQPENCYPPESEEIDVTELKVGDFDALFLMGGDLGEEIEAAISAEIEADAERAEQDAAEARAEARADDITCERWLV